MFAKSKSVTGILAAGLLLTAGSVNAAADTLPEIDSNLDIIIVKSIIGGEIARDPLTGMIQMDSNGMLMFDYDGPLHSVETNKTTGKVKELSPSPIGQIFGQAAFPMNFADMAIGMKMYMTGASTTMPAIPPVIEWTCNHCNMQIAGSTYISIVDAVEMDIPMSDAPGAPTITQVYTAMFGDVDAAVADLRLWGRAFTGLGPTKMDPAAQTMAIRMAGCSAVVAIDGPNKGKVGTLCMNSTANFDLSGVDLANPFTSQITANGSSNCMLVLHTPMPMM